MEVRDYFTSHGNVRQWAIVGTEARCILDALPQTDAGAVIALAKSMVVFDILDMIKPYIADHLVEVPGDEATEGEVNAYNAAQARINNASAIVQDVLSGDVVAVDMYIDETFDEKMELAEAMTPTANVVSDRQFAQALAIQGMITKDEALAWVQAGTIPASLSTMVNAIPDADARFAAQMLLGGAVEFNRTHPLVGVIAANSNMSASQVNGLFRLAAGL